MKPNALQARWLALSLFLIPHFSSAQTNLLSNAQQKRLDHRVLLHYSETQVADMLAKDPHKIKKLNYYYQKSYWVKENPHCVSCPDFNVKSFDVQNFEHLRPPTRKQALQLGNFRQTIILKPRNTLQSAYQNL